MCPDFHGAKYSSKPDSRQPRRVQVQIVEPSHVRIGSLERIPRAVFVPLVILTVGSEEVMQYLQMIHQDSTEQHTR